MKPSNKIIKPLLALTVIILCCSIFSRVFQNSETLTDYAKKNPDKAYQEDEASSSEMSGTKSDAKDTTVASSDVTSSLSDASGEALSPSDATDAALASSKDTDAASASSVASKHTAAADPSSDSVNKSSINDEYAGTDKRISLRDGFFYEPVPQEIIKKITGISYPDTSDTLAITLEDLSYMNVLYHDFNNDVQTGELICNKAIADDLLEIFSDLYKAGYQIDKIRLIDGYEGDDHLSMVDNNTSCFNYRAVDDSSKLSMHAYGRAIDINPYYNPYVTYENGKTVVSPEGSIKYADRTLSFPYKIDETDLCYKLFTEHGFTWGGNWNSCKDYQHFQKKES